MSDIELMQEQYKIGNYRSVVTAAEEDELIMVSNTFDLITESLNRLSDYITPGNEKVDEENYQALKALVGMDLDEAVKLDPEAEIEISSDVLVRVGQWAEGKVDSEVLDLLKERVAAFNEGKIYTVGFVDTPGEGEGYFANDEEIAECLAERYMLYRDENLREGEDDRGL